MQPDFNQKTIDTLAKRAAYRCSNPDCRILTVGPNSEREKSTVIGEAAHIFGARPSAKRYNNLMTDSARAEITNSIWLCRNCHKLIDADDQKYTTEILFAWREQHEKYTQLELGGATDRILYERQLEKLSPFAHYPPIIRRIIIDKAGGWEWRLAAELMRHLNRPLLRKLEDLRDGLYVKNQEYLNDEEVMKWLQVRFAKCSNLVSPLSGLLDRLTKSFGPPGISGDEEEIHHITCLIRDHLSEIVKYEEEISFVIVSERYKKIVTLLKGIIGQPIMQLAEIPESLDDAASLIEKDHDGTREEPFVIRKTLVFDFPKGWDKKFNRELRVLSGKSENSFSSIITAAIIIFIIVLIFRR